MALHIAPAIKLIGNSILLGMLEILAESFTLAEKSGVDAKDVQEVIKGMSLCLNSGVVFIQPLVENSFLPNRAHFCSLLLTKTRPLFPM